MRHIYSKRAIRWIWGPVATIIITAAYHALLKDFGLSATTAIFFILVVQASFWGGWPAGLLSALWGTGYNFYVTGDTPRTVQVGIAMFVSVLVLSWQSREIYRQAELARTNQIKADLVDSANGNINRLNDVLKILDDLIMGWDVLSEQSRKGIMEDIRNRLATMILLVAGWHALSRERDFVKKAHAEKSGEMK